MKRLNLYGAPYNVMAGSTGILLPSVAENTITAQLQQSLFHVAELNQTLAASQ